MAELSREQVLQLAKLAGLELDELRADTVAARLRAVLQDLDAIPDESIAHAEPLLTFLVKADHKEQRDG